jgi:insulysin
MRHRERLVSCFTDSICLLKTFELESLDDLTEIVTTLFSPIPNRDQEALPMIKEHPFGVDEKGVSCAPNLNILQKIMHPVFL